MGKKKTKWRKLPLEEFTKHVQPETRTDPEQNDCQTAMANEEMDKDPASNGTAENVEYYNEPYGTVDGYYYPTSCVVYNPADAFLYANYVMPADNYCYYYTVAPEVPQMQEYVPVTYQEYAPPLPKDTVYLLLPTQPPRPAPTVNNNPEWQNRRRRRRYEGYADYAIIPEKANSINVKDSENKKESNSTNYRRSSHRRASHSPVTKTGNHRSITESQTPIKSNENFASKLNLSIAKEQNSKAMETFDSNQTQQKSPDVCGVHSKNPVDKKDKQVTDENKTCNYKDNNLSNIENSNNGDFQTTKSNSTEPTDSKTNCSKESNSVKNQQIFKQDDSTSNPKSLSVRDTLPNSFTSDLDLPNTKVTTKSKKMTTSIKDNEERRPEDAPQNSNSTLPDILSSVNKSRASGKAEEIIEMNRNVSGKGMSSKAKSFMSQASSFPNAFCSETQNDLESELHQFRNIHSLQANQSIYKLAFDESIDSCESNSRSQSPIDPESQIPRSLMNNEILIHEADSGSEAGSEDIELIPHRYESETFLNENKHMYVNKLSLAVELLRTQENLPYDQDFKRVVPDNLNIVPVHSSRRVNTGQNDPTVNSATSIVKSNEKGELVSIETQHSARSSNDSAIFSDIDFESLEIDDMLESAKEVNEEMEESQESQRVRVGFRRLGAQAGYFSPRATFSLNPCFCCAIM